MRYTIRARHKIADPPDHWESAGFKMFENLTAASITADGMNRDYGKLWEYKVFEYHGRRDYREVQE